MSVRSRTPRSLLGALRRRLRPSALERRIAAFGLARGDVAIDCGVIRHTQELRANYKRLRERLEPEGLFERVLTDWV